MYQQLKIVYSQLFFICCALSFQTVSSQNNKSPLILKGEYVIDNHKTFDNTVVGGLSGIEYDSGSVFYLISDDKGEHGAPRFYKASIDYTKKGIKAVDILSVNYLTAPPGQTFLPEFNQADSTKFIFSDAESIRYDKSSGHLFWSSEGYHANGFLSQPFIFSMDTNGVFLSKLNTDPLYRFDPSSTKGPQHNSVFEALSLIPGSDNVVYCSEKSLLQDISSLTDGLKPIRVTIADKRSGNTLSQYAYMVDDVYKNNSNGVSEILALSADTFFVLERAFGFVSSIRLYKATIDNSVSDVKSYPSLKDKKYVPLKKELLLDFSTLGLKRVDNIEGMTWGHPLNGNKRSLLFVSDNNFNNLQITQLLLFEYENK